MPVMENYKISFRLETSIGVSGAMVLESTFVNYLIECLSTAGAGLHVIDKSDELSKQQGEGFEIL